MKTVVLATSNQGKLNELRTLLATSNIKVTSQSEYQISDADETGLTFIENAIIKARHAAKLTGLPAIADDSGLVVKALNGQPGIYSARYSGTEANAQSNNQKLLAELANIPDEQRNAYFYCALVFMRHADDPTPIICTGQWNGTIQRQIEGDGGFGYDPLFYLPELNCNAAQLTADQKNRLSHRGKAFQQLIIQLNAIE